ncbi:MAG: Sapep family Mn(2+)-dependent dipeptidase [Sarcina sp.]
MREVLNEKIDSFKEKLFSSIVEVVKIPSLESEAKEGKPFGEEVNNALLKALEIAEKLGFETKNIDGYMGYAQYGEGDDYIGVFGHLDVVETGEGWNDEPFSGVIKEGKIFGRGVLDNKGPIMSALYALYAIKECGVKLSKPVRIVFGTDEESGFKDLEYYLTKEKPPVMGFTPDCKYPVVYGERGRACYKLLADLDNRDRNVFRGYFDFITEYFLQSSNKGEKLGLDVEDKEFGITELRNFKFENDDDNLGFSFVVSYTPAFTVEEITNKIEDKMPEGVKLVLDLNYEPVKFEKDCFMVREMQKAYEENTGFDGTPVTTTGGTYAKAISGIVPFGPSFPGQKGISHNPNEYMDLSDIVLNTKIFASAIYRLAK